MTDKTKPLALESLEDLTQLADWLKTSGLNEVEVEIDGNRVRLSKGGVVAAAAAPAMVAQSVEAAPAPVAKAENKNVFKAPMVGTFYEAASPEAQAFVKVGDTVKAGQVICIIEAMKTMNQIESDRAGTVKAILAQNASPVEYGQPLFEIA